MSQTDIRGSLTQHAMLVVWGQYAQHLGLPQVLGAVPLRQKVRSHRPQAKVLEFLVAILAGLPHLKDISQGAHPLDLDAAVGRAWGQVAWADQSGVSRTLQGLAMGEAEQIVQALQAISQPFIDQEVVLAMRDQGGLVYDGDLTGRPVSNTSTTYPGVAYGHMSDTLHLGYQAALVSLHSPTYGRLWLSVTPHPGDTVSCTQAEALIRAAEARTGVRPWRRSGLLRERLAGLSTQRQEVVQRLVRGQEALVEAQRRRQETCERLQHWQAEVVRQEAACQARQRPERPHSRLAQARARLAVQERRQSRQEKAIGQVQRRVERQEDRHRQRRLAQETLQARLGQLERDNAANPATIRAILRLDAGFGTREDVALGIEMGYEVYTKPYSQRVTSGLRRRVTSETAWTRVGANAEMVAWPATQLHGLPYPLDVALERFYTGETVRYSTLLHYGQDPVTTDLPGWFQRYNGRQTIEAGIKEGKGVFQMHHLKVRAGPALLLQEHFATFAANFVRWAAHWLVTQCPRVPEEWGTAAFASVKGMVQVGAHTSAWVEWLPGGCLLRFTDQSIYAGRTLQAGEWAFQPPLPLFKS